MKIWKLKLLTAGLLCTIATTTSAANIVLNVIDGPGEGFNDPTPTNPVTGNPGITLGEQRLNVFLAASEFWEQRLQSDIDIVVDAQFDPLTCTPATAVLGAAGPLGGSVNFPNAPESDVIYAIAVANSLAGEDLNPGVADIGATFNSNLDLGSADCLGGQGWDYRIGVSTGSALELFATVLHELAHGLGFVSFHDLFSGELLAGFSDSFNLNLADQSTGLAWPAMTNAQRLVSSTNSGNLVWTGPRVASQSDILVNGIQPSGVQMFAPNPVQPGSSVSHWDTALNPDELMEPFSTASPTSVLTTNLLYDIGWTDPTLECNGLSVTVNLANGESPTQGDDVILGTSGPDLIIAEGGNDTICGEAGVDVIIAGDGNDYIDAGAGDDDIRGGRGNDVIFGGDGADAIDGGRGNDEIFGEAGDDSLLGSVGIDIIDGGNGVDSIRGGAGDDTIFTGSGSTVNSGVTVNGGGGNDTITGGPDADELLGEGGDDLILGDGGDDLINGGIGIDEMLGGSGNDEILGRAGSDILIGGIGNDRLKGGSSDDELDGGEGQDFCAGQAGDNDFIANCES